MNNVICQLQIESQLGECPIWSEFEESLYWIDALKGLVHCFNPKKGSNLTYKVGEFVSSVGLKKNGELILTLAQDLVLFNPKKQTMQVIGSLKKNKNEERFNDGKCDRKGRFWCTSKNPTEFHKNTGGLYRLDKDYTLNIIEQNVVTGNGMGWSPNNTLFYFTQTLLNTIFVYDFDLESGSINNKRDFVKIDPSLGLPDGLTIDADGYLWTAIYGGSCLLRYSPKGELVNKIMLPVPKVTSCTFGGNKFDTLYITTAQEWMTEEDIQLYPLSGSLFSIQYGYRGLPESYFEG